MAGGRPRTTSLPKNEMVQLGQEMVAWVRANNPIHLKQWYSLEKRFTYNQWKTMQELPEFLPYYEEALNLVSLNYINGTIHPSIAQRWQRIYFKDLKVQEDEDAKFEASLKNAEGDQVPENVLSSLESILSLMRSRQSARKIDDRSINNETKS